MLVAGTSVALTAEGTVVESGVMTDPIVVTTGAVIAGTVEPIAVTVGLRAGATGARPEPTLVTVGPRAAPICPTVEPTPVTVEPRADPT